MNQNKHKTILFAGGGTGGPVVPLLAIKEYLEANFPGFKYLLVGTYSGPEKDLAKHAHISFTSIVPVKYKRHCSICNIFIPIKFLIAFLQSFILLIESRPAIIVGAGGFIQVPVCLAGWVLRIPILIHQQDSVPSLSNLLIAPFAKKITTAFEKSIKDFSHGLTIKSLRKNPKIIWTGNPVRESLKDLNKSDALHKLHLDSSIPTILILGGGTGAEGVNNLIWDTLPLLSDYQIIHVTGKGKGKQIEYPNYIQLEFSEDMASLYAVASVVISRAGLSTLSELSFLKLPSIVIPMPDSHQEENAAWLEASNAAIVLNQKSTTAEILIQAIKNLLSNTELRHSLAHQLSQILPSNGAHKVSSEIIKIVE